MDKVQLLLLFSIAFCLRFFFQFFNIVLEGDEVVYTQLAKNLYYGKGYTITFVNFVSLSHPIGAPDLYWPPLLPCVIYFFFLIFGVSDFSAKLVPVVFGSLLIFPTYFLGKQLFNKKIGFLGAFLVAISRSLVWFSIQVFSDTLLAFFLAICAYWNIKNTEMDDLKYGILSGVFFGLAYLARFSAIIFLPILLFNLLLGKKTKKSVYSLFLFVASFFLIISPWLMRNFLLTGNAFFSEKSIVLANFMLGGNYEANFFGLTPPPSPIQLFLANPFGVISKWVFGIYLEYKIFPEFLSPLLFVLGCLGGIVSLDKWRQRGILFLLIFANIAFYGIAVYAGRIGAVSKYNLAIYPFFLIFCARGIQKLQDLIPKNILDIKIKDFHIKRHFITIIVIVITIEALATGISNIIRFEGKNDALELYNAGIWLKNSTSPDAILMSIKDITPYYAERNAVRIPFGNFSTIMYVAKKYEVQYIIIDERSILEKRPEQKYLLEENSVPSNLKVVYLDTASNYKVVIYLIISYDS
ncbi:MAG: ArnT family glycosyltransferase [Promethearchaeota archaeon]